MSSWPRSERRRTDEHQEFPDLHTRLPAAPRPDEIPPPGPARLHRGSLYGKTVLYPVASLTDVMPAYFYWFPVCAILLSLL